MTDFGQITKREIDNSYVIIKDSYPYHVPNTEEFADEYKAVDEYAQANPSKVTVEAKPADPTLDELKEAKITELKESFNTVVSGSFTCTYGWPMQFNDDDVSKMEGAIKLIEADSTQTPYVVAADNTVHTGVTLDDMKAIQLEMMKQYAKVYLRKQEIRQQIVACTAITALSKVDINFNV
jgi:hypothetical protein